MEEQKNTIATLQDEVVPETGVSPEDRKEISPKLEEIHENFPVFGGISLAFGIAFTFCFYKADMGLNSLLFTMATVALLIITMKKLSMPVKKMTKVYYAGVVLLGLSSMLTSSETLQFYNTVGILLLLEVSLIRQFQKEEGWDFLTYPGKMAGLVLHSIKAFAMPFLDGLNFLKRVRIIKNERSKNMILGTFIALPVLFVVMALLSNADLMFGKIIKDIFVNLFSYHIFSILLLIIFCFLACYCIICGSAGYGAANQPKSRTKADPMIAVTAMAWIMFVYVLFCGIQIIYLFAHGMFVLPVEFTYAEYARQGFFELLAVTVINLLLILLCTKVFRENKILNYILTGMSICTYIMIASAVYRMLLYIGAYRLTFLRLFVLLFLLMDALVLAGVIFSIYHRAFPLFHYSVVVVSVCYLIFSLGKPDYFIAVYNIRNYAITDEDEMLSFLTEGQLSLDAAGAVLPVLSKMQEAKEISDADRENRKQSIENYYYRIKTNKENRGIREFNYSIDRAYLLTEKYPLQ